MIQEEKIKKCVKALPEIYQNIYGHEEYNNESSRKCEEREQDIIQIIKSYQTYLGKEDIKVLDLGCAQGYYSFCLQNIGCKVNGIDFNQDNINCCNALKEENGLQCNFAQKKIDMEFIDSIKDNTYDVILILSVIHHVCHEHGFQYAQDLMTKLANKGSFVITELALKEEPLYWNETLPEKYSRWFDNVSFYNEISYKKTHLSFISRPLIFYSNKYVLADNNYYKIDRYSLKSFEAKREDVDRRYYLCNDILVKMYRGDNPEFISEIIRESEFIQKNKDVIKFLPDLIYKFKSDQSIIAIYKIVKGQNLWDLLQENKGVNLERIFSDILNNLIELEDQGYYHGDLRIWNICLDEHENAFLIDFGNMQTENEDYVAQYFIPSCKFTTYESFMSILYDCLTKEDFKLLRSHEIYEIKYCYQLSKLSREYINLFKKYLLLDDDQISFKIIKNLFNEYILEKNSCSFSAEEEFKICNKLLERSFMRSSTAIDVKAACDDLSRSINTDLNMKYNMLESRLCLAEEKVRILEAKIGYLENTTWKKITRKIKSIIKIVINKKS